MKEQGMTRLTIQDVSGEELESLRVAELASAKARGETLSANDERFLQAFRSSSAENVEESHFWQELVRFADSQSLYSEGPNSQESISNRVQDEDPVIQRVLSLHRAQLRFRAQKKWALGGAFTMISAAALWAMLIVDPSSSIWIGRNVNSQDGVEHAVMSSQSSNSRGEARPRSNSRRKDSQSSFLESQPTLDSIFAVPDHDQSRESVRSKLNADAWIDPELDSELKLPDGPTTDSSAPIQQRRSKTVDSPERMLLRAQKQLTKGNRRGAWVGYRALLRRYPNSQEAKVSLVSLGRIALQLGNTKRSLKYFDRYIRLGEGSLSKEARYGKIEALRQLKDRTREIQAIREFLAKIPDSVYHSRLRLRLEQFRLEQLKTEN